MSVSIIPLPNKIIIQENFYHLPNKITISSNSDVSRTIKLIKSIFQQIHSFNYQFIEGKEEKADISLILNKNLQHLDEEGYKLTISEQGILIEAFKENGLFYAIQTLLQLLPPDLKSIASDIKLPVIEIEDKPRFSYRGFMFDEGRHFHGMNEVKRLLDIISFLKLNTFHWHLTEDQGWRIEIKKYPKLTEIGSKREESQIGGFLSFLSKKSDKKPHEGFYTQEEIKEIIEYAKDRFITIIPEIDMPGHIMSALAAYPELGCTEGPYNVETTWGIKKDVLCVGKQKSMKFIYDILDEIMEIFPSNIIHTGGDEVPKDRWQKCKYCQKKIEDENLKDEHHLQEYFTSKIIDYIHSKGKIFMGWNEVLNDNFDRNAIAQHWLKDDEKVVAHLRKGGKAVISRFFYYYLDYPYTMTPLKKTYSLEPIPDEELEQEFRKNVIGVEGTLWSEWIPTRKKIDWQSFPRLIAIAETAWTSKENKNYTSFITRLKILNNYLNQMNINYATIREVNPNFLRRLITPLKLLFVLTI